MSWDKVDSVRADTPLNVSTKDGRTVQGTVALVNGAVDVTSAATRETVPAGDVTGDPECRRTKGI